MKIIKGKIACAKKVVIYGPEGIGKSTFSSRFPEPLFIDTEGSTKDMDVSRFENPSSWQMLLEQIRYVRANPSICKTLIIDTADWAEQMCVADLCARHGKKGIEDFGYGNGYVYAKEEFGRFLNALEDVIEAGINVVLTAHAHIKSFNLPDEMGSYDRWEMKLGKKTSSQTSPLVKEWADMVLFVNYKTWSVAADKEGKRHKAQGGARVMYTSHHPCWDAKNRYQLPEEIPFEYESIRHVIEGKTSEAPASVANTADVQNPPIPPVENHSDFQPAISSEAPIQTTMDLPTEIPEPETITQPSISDTSKFQPDDRIPKALRDLMIANNVCEWDIQNVVFLKGHFPADMNVWDYPIDYINGVLVGAWEQVFRAMKEMKEKEAIPFN